MMMRSVRVRSIRCSLSNRRGRPLKGYKEECEPKGRRRIMSARLEELIGNAILGIDTLWGGDVLCASGTGRFIADSWFSDEPLPIAYTAPSAAKLREWGGVTGKSVDRAVVDQYLRDVDIPAAIS